MGEEPVYDRPVIRAATLSDVAAITAIYDREVAGGTASWEYDPPGEAEMRRRFETITGAGFPYFAADVAGDVAGYAYASPYRPRPGYRFTVEDSIYINPRFQGRGVGKALLARLIGQCERLGYHQMIAVIGDSENTASIRLHASLGFTHAGMLAGIGFKHGRWLDSVLMQRALNRQPPLDPR